MEQTLDMAVLEEFPEEKIELVDRLLKKEIWKDSRKMIKIGCKGQIGQRGNGE